MSRRRRLVLRQVAEPVIRAALSDVEDELAMDEPNFNLLGMMQAASTERTVPAPPLPASTQQLEYEDGDHDMDQASTQLVSSRATVSGTAEQPTKKPRVEIDQVAPKTEVPPTTLPATTRVSAPSSDPASRGVFQLYQKGLSDDHTLRLHFIRRKPPPPPPVRIEDEFVLPRPELSIFDLLPTRSTSIHDILTSSDDARDDTVVSTGPVDGILLEAISHWRLLADVPTDRILTWRVLRECDWTQVYEQSGSCVPCVRDLVRVLETLRSDAFALFVWRVLMIPAVQSLHDSKASTSETARFSSALLHHECFRRMAARDFRAQLRAKNLRAHVPSVGAILELALIDEFHKFRNPDGLLP